jgi:hypothetical protein
MRIPKAPHADAKSMKRHLRTLTKPKNEIINMKHREYNIYSKKDGWKRVSHGEWAAWVRAGNRASLVQVVSGFGPVEYRNFLQVCTGPSNRRNRAAGEWESRVWDAQGVDLVNPLYCPGSIEEIDALHGRALSNARKFLRNYVERPIPYWENILNGSDPRYLAKTPDFAVEYFEENIEDDDEDA